MSQNTNLTEPVPTKTEVTEVKDVPLSHRLYFHLLIFLGIFIITLVVFTWFLYNLNRDTICRTDLNFWCFDDWECQKTCGQNDAVDDCFKTQHRGSTGLAQCLYGINSKLATICNVPDATEDIIPADDPSTAPPTCACPTSFTGTDPSAQNCLSYCAGSIGDLITTMETITNPISGFCGCNKVRPTCGTLPET